MSWYWVTSIDGSLNHKVEAPNQMEALDLMARHHGYASYKAFCNDLHYGPGDLRVAVMRQEPPQQPESGARQRIEREQASAVAAAWKALRRRDRGDQSS